MPNITLTVFMRPSGMIVTKSFVNDKPKSFAVTVRMIDPEGGSEITIFADSLSQLFEVGRAIVAECEAMAPDPASDALLASPPDTAPAIDGQGRAMPF